MSSRKPAARAAYHHGDLRRELLAEAEQLLRTEGLAALSLRKLAERVGVSPAALYHHVRDKQALLCALGEEAAQRLVEALRQGISAETDMETRFERFVAIYVRFALDNPELYELLFGRTSWKAEGEASEAFRARARAAFRTYAELVESLQAQGHVAADLNPLRLAQVSWATLHGLCCMHNDGLAFRPADVEEISQYARWLLQRLRQA